MRASTNRATLVLRRVIPFAFVVLIGCSTTGRGQDQPATLVEAGRSPYDTALRVKLPHVAPEEDRGLHNVYRLSAHVISGSEPHGEEAFRKLREMGVRTILSVDGKVPDAELARTYGMAYVHVPIQYRGISEEQMLQLVKTFREREGPFYVHCFHGKHRGPAAAAIGRLVLDGASRDQAIAEMRQWCGTSPSYEGLYRAVAEAPIPDEEATRSYPWDFPSAHPFQGFRHAMIEIARADDNLKYLSRRGFEPGADHPDVDAVNEATKLASAFERAAALDEIVSRPSEFRRWLDESVRASASLRDALVSWRTTGTLMDRAGEAYDRQSQLCVTCHKSYRND